jgi:hypothetical protein
VEPNLRISVKEMMKKSFFKDMDWEKIRKREIDEDDIPYKPNPNKYKYLLINEYEEKSNLIKFQPGSANTANGLSPEEPTSA